MKETERWIQDSYGFQQVQQMFHFQIPGQVVLKRQVCQNDQLKLEKSLGNVGTTMKQAVFTSSDCGGVATGEGAGPKPVATTDDVVWCSHVWEIYNLGTRRSYDGKIGSQGPLQGDIKT